MAAKERDLFLSIMLLNPFTALSNNNDVRLITAELIESEIPQQNINVFNYMPRPNINLLYIICHNLRPKSLS